MQSRNKTEGAYLEKIQDRHVRGRDPGVTVYKRKNPDGSFTVRKVQRAPSIGTALKEMRDRTRGAYDTWAWLTGVRVPR